MTFFKDISLSGNTNACLLSGFLGVTLLSLCCIAKPALPESRAESLAQAESRNALDIPFTGDAQKLGTNGFHWIPQEDYKAFAAVREYLHWDWMEVAQGQNRFDPSDGGNGQFDQHFADMKAAGKTLVACINESPAWLTQNYEQIGNVREYKPIPLGESALNPESYRHFARFLYQLSARYGREKIAAERLSVNSKSRWTNDPQNKVQSGLDLLQYIEVWNEPDKNWSGRNARFEPEEYAAMLSACYDGHEGKLGAGFGIKTADPTMQVVMGGLSNFDLPYMRRMLDWFEKNRKDKRFAADVVNYHHYCNKTSWLNGSLTEAISPEADKIREKLSEVMAFNAEKTPYCKVWYSEFGYDTDPSSPQHCKAYGDFSAVDVQGMWILRTYLESLAAGVDKCFIYNVADERAIQNGLFQSSGVVLGEDSGFKPKASWYKILDLAQKINGYVFQADLSPSATQKLYVFKQEVGKGRLYIGWLASSNSQSEEINSPIGKITLGEEPQFFIAK